MDPYKSNIFMSLDKDRSGTIDEYELYNFFCKEFGATFDPIAITTIVKMFKTPGVNGLNCHQFSQCYDNIQQWKQAFYNLDRDRSGTIGLIELDTAFRGYNMVFKNQTLQLILRKYDSSRRGSLSFVDFFRAMVTVKLLSTRYGQMRPTQPYTNYNTSKTPISLNELLNFAMNNADLITPSLIQKK